MAHEFMTDAWAQAYRSVLNQSAEYRSAAANWEGDFVFVCDADDALPDARYTYLDLWHGTCRAARATQTAVDSAEFTISAPLSVWQQLLTGTLDPIKGLIARRLILQGNMVKVLDAPGAAVAMVNCARQIETTWPS